MALLGSQGGNGKPAVSVTNAAPAPLGDAVMVQFGSRFVGAAPPVLEIAIGAAHRGAPKATAATPKSRLRIAGASLVERLFTAGAFHNRGLIEGMVADLSGEVQRNIRRFTFESEEFLGKAIKLS